MERKDFVKRIAEETGLSRPDVRKVIEAMEDEVMEIIATEDFIEFSFAKIEGYTKPPWRVTGMYRALPAYQKNGHWSDAKVGYPKCTFTREAKDWLAMDPHIYFEQPEHKFTSNARKFRQENDIEEISEYKDLSEEEIKKLCLKADRKALGPVPKHKIGEFNRSIKMKEKQKQSIFLLMQAEDLERQRKAGVAEEDLVYKDHDQLVEEYYAMEKERQNTYLEAHPGIKIKRERISMNRQKYKGNY